MIQPLRVLKLDFRPTEEIQQYSRNFLYTVLLHVVLGV